MDNRTALVDLQSEKDLLEREAAALRQSLHELRQAAASTYCQRMFGNLSLHANTRN